MNNTNLVFVVGSGRCGTRMMKSLLGGVPHIEARHEYVRNAYQREAGKYYLGLISRHTMFDKLRDIYEPAAHYSQAAIFLDASHKLAWCVDVLAEAFPRAKFVHLVRDGRKVVSSFFYKLHIFEDYGAQILRDWMAGKEANEPPITEEYWQPASLFDGDMFQRICYHWHISNANILQHLEPLSEERKLFIRLEDLAASKDEMRRFLAFLDTPYDDSFHAAMQKPKHVYVPIDYQLTDEQEAQFRAICAPMMKILNYNIDEREYHVTYQM